MTAYDTNNIFAKILRGELPCHKVYEDEHVFAFLDIMPRVPGHTLVIPKAPARNILDIKPDDYAHVARGAHKIAAAAMKAFNADGITVQQFNEPAGGQVVFHLHMHVMPRHDGVAMLPPASRKEDDKLLQDHAAKLIAALKLPDYYALLGLNTGSHVDEVHAAYRNLARKYHPDVCREANAHERFCLINDAHATLSDPKRRKEYDQLYILRQAA